MRERGVLVFILLIVALSPGGSGALTAADQVNDALAGVLCDGPASGAIAAGQIGSAPIRPMEPELSMSEAELARAVVPDGVPDGVSASVTRGGEIPVYFHVIRDDSGAGDVSDDRIDAQIAVMNGAFGPLGWNFVLVATDRWNNSQWFHAPLGSPEQNEFKQTLHVGSADDLNVYTIEPAEYVGFGWYPWAYAGDPGNDGVILHHEVVSGGTALLPQWGDHVALHEVGHWMGLLHTFEGGCGPIGDDVDDTPAQRTVYTGVCPSAKADSCRRNPGLDPIHNYMGYTSQNCTFEFTPGQSDRMDYFFALFRFRH
jgi:hypothetical protein